ncbi:hypothetical protein FQA47_020856 [Oryzias melastigma]|uniref:Uncharacterized protein n=1 Tax=Oryzias melastigma TaxID=30732 RepID=A0A834CLC7_ORYME|nr:hypothetical protein FQA47_020856 [Oryzias melastigma]
MVVPLSKCEALDEIPAHLSRSYILFMFWLHCCRFLQCCCQRAAEQRDFFNLHEANDSPNLSSRHNIYDPQM